MKNKRTYRFRIVSNVKLDARTILLGVLVNIPLTTYIINCVECII